MQTKLSMQERSFWINFEVNPQLFPLSKTKDYEISDPEKNVLGWSVYDSGGKKIGEISDLLIDAMCMQTRYFELSTIDELLPEGKGERRILISAGAAELDADGQLVRIKSLTYDNLVQGFLPVSPYAGMKGYLYYSQEVFAPGLLPLQKSA